MTLRQPELFGIGPHALQGTGMALDLGGQQQQVPLDVLWTRPGLRPLPEGILDTGNQPGPELL